MRSVLAFAFVVAACNLDSDLAPVPDAATDAATPRCDLTRGFEDIALVPNVNTAENEYSARLSESELALYVTSDSFGGLAVATRETKDEPFGTPDAIDELNTASNFEGQLSITSDDRTIYYVSSSFPGATGGFDIVTATRGTATPTFDPPTEVTTVNTTSSEFNAFVVPDGKTLYLASDIGGHADLYFARLFGGQFMDPVALDTLATPAHEDYPTVTPDGLTIYFARCADNINMQTCDIFFATRASTDDSFDPATAVVELNGATTEFPTWISADGCTLYFSSNRPGSSADRLDIYQATRGK